MSMKERLVIIITKEDNVTHIEYVGDRSLLEEYAKSLAVDVIQGRFTRNS